MKFDGKRGKRDLVVLVADKDMQLTMQGLLSSRQNSLRIRQIQFDIHAHPQHDPGTFHQCEEFLRPFASKYRHAIVMFDREGSGREAYRTAEELERDVEARLFINGWNDRSCAIVPDPELEIWVWTRSPKVSESIGWPAGEDLFNWMAKNGLWDANEIKPAEPKNALETVLRKIHRPRSSAIYSKLATTVGFSQCTDRAFVKLVSVLQDWFPVG